MFPYLILALLAPLHDSLSEPASIVKSSQSKPTVIDGQRLPSSGTHVVPAQDGTSAWVIRSSNQSIDLSARLLKSSKDLSGQSNFTGTGLLLDGCKDLTVKNVNVSGFRINILLKNCTNVRLLNCSANLSRAIKMGNEGKPIDTFLNLRDIASWRNYGAGIWLENCSKCLVSHCEATAAQNGLLLVNSNENTIFNNSCSYNSGWGIGLWKSSRNVVDWNHADFCNRPWSGGWGGDAAGLVMANSSNMNSIVGNSLTFGGDGFFLTDRVNGGFDSSTQKFNFEGSSNRNIVAYNDGSWSSNNAFEGTFSEGNTYYQNVANNSNYGFWLGFSSHMFLNLNIVRQNRSEGVAIGQGQQNTLFRNQIEGNSSIGVHIWSDKGAVESDQPSDQNAIIENRIVGSKVAINLDRSTNYQVLGNTIEKGALPKSIRTGFPSFAQIQSLEGWSRFGEVKRIEALLKLRPIGWKYFTEMGNMDSVVIKVGDYSPVRN